MEEYINSGSFRDVYDCGNGWVVKYPTNNWDADYEFCDNKSDYDCTKDYEDALEDWNNQTCEESLASNIDEIKLFKKYGRKYSCLCKIDVKRSNEWALYMKKIIPFKDRFHTFYEGNDELVVEDLDSGETHYCGKMGYKYYVSDELISMLYRMAAAGLVNGYEVKKFAHQVNLMEKEGINIRRDLEPRNIGFDGDAIKILDYGWY